jgi:hypothetical protein
MGASLITDKLNNFNNNIMKIVNTEEMAKLPEGILYSAYEPCILGELRIKGKTLNEGNNSTEWAQWFDADINNVKDIDDDLESGDSSPLEIIYSRDVYEPEELFAVWEVEDLKELSEVINNAIKVITEP